MATFDTFRTTSGTSSAVSGVFAALSNAASRAATWNDARITRNALSSLTERELKDIGLVRGDIDYIATSDLIR